MTSPAVLANLRLARDLERVQAHIRRALARHERVPNGGLEESVLIANLLKAAFAVLGEAHAGRMDWSEERQDYLNHVITSEVVDDLHRTAHMLKKHLDGEET